MTLQEYLLQLTQEMPEWLMKFDAESKFNSIEFFNSRIIFYPNSGFDGQAVKVFGESHSAHCFVYVDYSRSKQSVLESLNDPRYGFLGYATSYRIELTIDQITPNNWTPHLEPGDLNNVNYQFSDISPFGFLQILDRKSEYFSEHGAKRLAILFLGADGVATYDALFAQEGTTPPFATVLQDHGFGGQYSSFGAGGLLEKIAHRSQQWPEYLLVAEGTAEWSDYQRLLNVDGNFGGEWAQHKRFLYQRPVHSSPSVDAAEVIIAQESKSAPGKVIPLPLETLAQSGWTEQARERFFSSNDSFENTYARNAPSITINRLLGNMPLENRNAIIRDARLIVKRLTELMPHAVHASTGIEGDQYLIWLCLGMINPNVTDEKLTGMIHGESRIGLTCIGGQIFLVLRQMAEADSRPNLMLDTQIPAVIRDNVFAYIEQHLRPEGQQFRQRRVHLPLNPIMGGFAIPGHPLTEGSPLTIFLRSVDQMYLNHTFLYHGEPTPATDLIARFCNENPLSDDSISDVVFPGLYDNL